MESKQTILVVEDNPDIATQLVDFLIAKGCIVDYASDGRSARRLIDEGRFDIVILDLMLPDTDGLSVCDYIKRNTKARTPVLMLTARDSLDDKLQGFDVGADDYLTKPFFLEEVYVRCQALARRKQLHQSSTLTVGDLHLDTQRHEARRNGKVIALSKTDFAILVVLAEAYPNAVSKREIAERLWGDDQPDTDTVRSHVYTLRNALDKPFAHAMIKTVHGIGFRLDADNAANS